MQSQGKRHIDPTKQFDALIPQSMHKDAVIKASGDAKLSDTLELMQKVIRETLADTILLAKNLKGHSVVDTCRNIWHFVYRHIQYTMDKVGIEQVRRPSRSWADRMSGVDCDCYTVFIGSILTNLNIPFKIRITKYGGKSHFQHVYPVVFTKGKQITIDCVTDQFNYEVPYSEKKDIVPDKKVLINDISGISGVDTIDISLDALTQSKIPLHQITKPTMITAHCHTHQRNRTPSVASKTSRVLSPFRFKDEHTDRSMDDDKFDLFDFFIKATISVGLGIGVYRLFAVDQKSGLKKKNSTNRL